MNKYSIMYRSISCFLGLALLGASFWGLLVPGSAEAANGKCKWEGGAGAPFYQECAKEDCLGEGGYAICSEPKAAPNSGLRDHEGDADGWTYGFCDRNGWNAFHHAAKCHAAGGTWNGMTEGCSGEDPGRVAPLKDGDDLPDFVGDYAWEVWGSEGHRCGPPSGGGGGWGFNAGSGGYPCYSGGSETQNGQATRDLARATYNGMRESNPGVCDIPKQVVIDMIRSRRVLCEEGYATRTKPNGDTQCYILPEDATCPSNNPVRPASGTKLKQEVDYMGSGVGSLPLVRHYHSRGYFRLGKDNISLETTRDYWRHSYDRSLYTTPSGLSAIVFADGTLRHFDATGVELQNRDGAAYRLQPEAGGGWTLTDREGNLERYSAQGQLAWTETRSGLRTTLHYDANARLEAVEDAFGRTLVFGYDTAGRWTHVVTPDGTITYGYSSTENLERVTYPDQRSRVYHYEDANDYRLLTGITDESGVRYSTYTYDSQGRATSSSLVDGIERLTFSYPSSSRTIVADALGAVRNYDYATHGNVLKQTSISQPCGSCGGSNQSVSYDAAGNVDIRIEFGGVRTDYDHDAQNREILRTEGLSSTGAVSDATRSVATQWHATFRLPVRREFRDHAGAVYRVETLAYDARGNLLTRTEEASGRTRTWTYTHDAIGRVLTLDGPRTDVADVTTYAYFADDDACLGCRGQLQTVTDALGHVTRYVEYDGAGRPLEVRDANDVVTTFDYDLRGRLESRTQDAEGTPQTTTYGYDANGSLTSVTSDGHTLSYEYDAAHRLVAMQDAVGNRVEYVLDKLGNKLEEKTRDASGTLQVRARSEYDALNRLVRALNGTGEASHYEYDGAGNAVAEQDPVLGLTTHTYDVRSRLRASTDPLRGTTQFDYDADDHLTRVVDAKGLATRYVFDGLGDQTRLESPDTGVTTYATNDAGQRTQQTDARGITSIYRYDALGRLSAVEYPTASLNTTFVYDALVTPGCSVSFPRGRLTSMFDASGSTHYCYDAFGRVTKKRQIAAGVTADVGYGYDGDGRLEVLTYPDGGALHYGRDAAGRITSASWHGASGVQPVVTGVTYHATGQVASLTYASGVQTRTFDAAGRISGIEGEALASASRVYGYDAMHRIVSSTDAQGGVKEGFAYDAIGNRTSKTTASGTEVYGYAADSHRLMQVGAQARTYDAVGNTTGMNGATLAYDDRNRLVGYQGAQTAAYQYSGRGERVSKTLGGVAAGRYVFDEGGQVLVDESSDGGALVRSEVLWLGSLPIGVVRGGVVYLVQADQLGSPRVVVDAARDTAIWRWDVAGGVFGDGAADSDVDGDGAAWKLGMRFPGQYFDKESGLHYNYFRDYEKETGRYVESDPIGLVGGISTYSYALNRPTSLYDTLGLTVWSCTRPMRGFGLIPHDYVCASSPVPGASPSCGGHTSATLGGALWSDGVDSNEQFNEDHCQATEQGPGDCEEKCVRWILRQGRPLYSAVMPGVKNCWDWAADTINYCKTSCAEDPKSFDWMKY